MTLPYDTFKLIYRDELTAMDLPDKAGVKREVRLK